MTDLFDSAGRPVSLGTRLGSGGEGTVYEVDRLGEDCVAKVYHVAISPEKQAKLRAMAQGCDEPLKRIAAWPFETLHTAPGGEVCGFLMPKLVGYEPIHHLYSPAHRKQRFPDKDWAFLVNTARNTAAAFETIHRHGHVIGDVNPNLVFFAENSIVRLVDCDSFQISCDGNHFMCEVGVPHFTPPELQFHASFRGIQRTSNHDNFGLALLVFHLLLMGRHPFSGVFPESDYIPIEQAIGLFYYTFGRDAAHKHIAPPPNSITPDILPESIALLFERAFTREGCQPGGRPTAGEWIAALDLLREQITTCQADPAHKYYGGLSACPWCREEKRSGTYYYLSFEVAASEGNGFDLESVWEAILAVASPGPAPCVNTSACALTPQPLPAGLKGFLGLLRPLKMARESKRRQVALEDANKRFALLSKEWEMNAGAVDFQLKMDELSSLKGEYERLVDLVASERKKLQDNRRESQLQRFLGQFFLDTQYIQGIGSEEKAMLASFGIETAADLGRYNLIRLNRLGAGLANGLIEWRNSLEHEFVFDPSSMVDPADVAEVSRRFARRRRQIEAELLAGPAELMAIRTQALAVRTQMLPKIEAAARQVAQAETDLALMR